MTQLVVSLDEPAARLPSVTGGKGSSLARMRAAGLPVPNGFVASVAAYALVGGSIPDELTGRLSSLDPADTAALESACDAIRRSIARSGVPDDVRLAVSNAFDSLDGHGSVSVRSSATAEDQPWASFAGQYDTFLNVDITPDAVLDRLLAVWQSLYSPRAVAYRQRLGIEGDAVAMAVVVQAQMRPSAAGVLFTRNPVTGDNSRLVVNAALGLGEGVVAGTVPSDTFEMDAVSLAVVSEAVSTKDTMVSTTAGGGIEVTAVTPSIRDAPALTPSHLTSLGGLAHRIKGLFHGDQDIEFAVEGDTVHILQARPVTGDGPPFPPVVWDDPADEAYRWSQSEGPLYRLQEDAVMAYTKNSAVCFKETGASMCRNHIFQVFHGYSYTRSPELDEKELTTRQESHRQRDAAYREQGSNLYEAEIEPAARGYLKKLDGFRPRRASLQDLSRHLDEVTEAYGHVMGDLHWRMASAIRLDWPEAFHEITGEPEVASGKLLMAIPNTTYRLVRRLRGMARLAQEDPELGAAIESRDYDRLAFEPLQSRSAVRQFRQRLGLLLRDYGHRTGSGFGSDTTFSTPSWNMAPDRPLDLVRSFARQDMDDLDRRDSSARRERVREVRRIRRKLAADPEKLQRFNREYPIAVEGMNRMEDHNHLMEQGITGVLREAIHWAGVGFTREGLLSDPLDIRHLSTAEISAAASGEGPAGLRALVRERSQEHERQSRTRAPATLGNGPPPPPDTHRARYDAPDNAGLDGTVIRGTGASPGRYTGRARVVPVGPEPPAVERGDILVVENAGPAWTPVFPLLGGLVLDGGAVFQHAALVAREYGIPAVVMTREATRVVLDGQTIAVDADQGIVDLDPSG